MKMKNSIGERIAYHRKMNAMTQEELAGKLNVSTQAVSKWEQKISSPDIRFCRKLQVFFLLVSMNCSERKLIGNPCLIQLIMFRGTMTEKYELQFIMAKNLCNNQHINFKKE